MSDDRRRRKSVYERRGSWLRRVLGRNEDRGSELIVSRDGSPQIVVGNGRIIGFRQKDGGVLRIPEQPVDEWLESDWGAESVEEGELAPSGLRRRWR